MAALVRADERQSLAAWYLPGYTDGSGTRFMTQKDLTSLADVQRLLPPDNPQIARLHYAIHHQPGLDLGSEESSENVQALREAKRSLWNA